MLRPVGKLVGHALDDHARRSAAKTGLDDDAARIGLVGVGEIPPGHLPARPVVLPIDVKRIKPEVRYKGDLFIRRRSGVMFFNCGCQGSVGGRREQGSFRAHGRLTIGVATRVRRCLARSGG